MKEGIGYIEHEGKAVVTDGRFAHVMALALDPRSKYTEGVIRCITSREGNVQIASFVDRSILHNVSANPDGTFSIGDQVVIENAKEVADNLIEQAGGAGWDFIGLEDPDIWIDKACNMLHLYCTLPLINHAQKTALIHLAHASGHDLSSLRMSNPVLEANPRQIDSTGAKELSIAPLNSKGFRYNLIESGDKRLDVDYSIIRTTVTYDMGASWEYGEIAFHPDDHNIPWIAGHASPGPLLPKSFIDIGENKLLGIINGREANQKIGTETKYGMFSVGLFIYDYEHGKIDWVSKEPFIQDSEAVTITFASQFVETKPGKGILYAHVDDSFVRAYTLDAHGMKKLLP